MSFATSADFQAKKTIKTTHSPLYEKIFDHVMTFGTFDIFHPGHEFYLSEGQKFAQKMTVVVARDARVEKIKGRPAQDNENIRVQNVQNAFPDATVVLGDEGDIFAPIRDFHPDILVFGYDQRVPLEKLHELFPTLEYARIGGYETEKWKSSKLRK